LKNKICIFKRVNGLRRYAEGAATQVEICRAAHDVAAAAEAAAAAVDGKGLIACSHSSTSLRLISPVLIPATTS
jgi:hypothetical protein